MNPAKELLLQPLLDEARPWLAKTRPFVGDWASGCHWVAARVESLWHSCSGSLFGLTGSLPEELAADAQRRLWLAWSWHWHHALTLGPGTPKSVDGEWVLQRLRDGHRPGLEQSLGGDPLFDVVLATSCSHHQPEALRRFRSTFRSVYERRAELFWGHRPDVDEFDDFLIQLIGGPMSAALDRFRGYTTLKRWLYTVVRRYLTSKARSKTARERAEQKATPTREAASPADLAEWRESIARLGREIRATCAQLTPRQQETLHCFSEGLNNNAIAARMGITASRVSQLRTQALSKLGAALSVELESAARQPDRRVWLRALLSCSLARRPESTLPESTLPESTLPESTLPPRSAALDCAIPQIDWNIVTDEQTMIKELPAAPEVDTPTSDAAATGHPPVANSPEPLEGVVEVSMERSVDREFDRLTMLDDRPTVVCLDGRQSTPDQVAAWLDQFDCRIGEELDAATTSGREPFDPHRVLFVPLRPDWEPLSEWHDRPDVDCVRTDREEPVATLYGAVLDEDLATMQAPIEGSTPATAEFRSMRDTTAPEHQASWDRRMDQLRDWNADADQSTRDS